MTPTTPTPSPFSPPPFPVAVLLGAGIAVAGGLALLGLVVHVDPESPWGLLLHPVACVGHGLFAAGLAGVVRTPTSLTPTTDNTAFDADALAWHDRWRDLLDGRAAFSIGLALVQAVLLVAALVGLWTRQTPLTTIHAVAWLTGTGEALLLGLAAGVTWQQGRSWLATWLAERQQAATTRGTGLTAREKALAEREDRLRRREEELNERERALEAQRKQLDDHEARQKAERLLKEPGPSLAPSGPSEGSARLTDRVEPPPLD